jgi:VanZ family protein
VSSVHTSRARHLSLWLPVVVYTTAIYFVSGLPVAPLPDEVSDKTGHMAAYAGLAILAVRALGGGLPCRVVWRVAWLALVIAAGYGAFDELHQLFVPGRTGELLDWYADVSGAVIGIGACWLWGMIAIRSDRTHRV